MTPAEFIAAAGGVLVASFELDVNRPRMQKKSGRKGRKPKDATP